MSFVTEPDNPQAADPEAEVEPADRTGSDPDRVIEAITEEQTSLGLAADPRLLSVARAIRKILPGDANFGEDPLSTAGDKPSQVLVRNLADATAERPSLMREAGLSALQVWDAISHGVGRIPGNADMTIAFTDLVKFSDWSLKAGDTAAVELLREVSLAIEPPVVQHTGKVVKRLGDGMMAVFASAADAIEALADAQERIATVEVAGYTPQLRAGLHTGRPERIGDDYFGVDVNIAARVAEAAHAGEILASDTALADLDRDRFDTKRKLLFRAKGVPPEVKVYSVRRRA